MKINRNGIKLFELCDAYNVDVRFVMAQAQAESHFGTTGIAAKKLDRHFIGIENNPETFQIAEQRLSACI